MRIDVTGTIVNGALRVARGTDELLARSWRHSLEQALLAQDDPSGRHQEPGAPSGRADARSSEAPLQREGRAVESGVAGRVPHDVRSQTMVQPPGRITDAGAVKLEGIRASSDAEHGQGGRAADGVPSAQHTAEWQFATPQVQTGPAGGRQTTAGEGPPVEGQTAFSRATSSASKAHLFVERTGDGLVLWVRDKHSPSAALDVAVSALMQDARARGFRFSAVHLNGKPYAMDIGKDDVPDPRGAAVHPSEQPTLADGSATNLSAKEA